MPPDVSLRDVLESDLPIFFDQQRDLVVTSNLVGTMQEFYDVFREVLVEAQDAEGLASLEKHIRHRATPDSLRTQLEGAGFHVAQVSTNSFKLRFASGTALLRHAFMRIGFVPAWRETPAPALRDVLFEKLEQRLNERAQELGDVALTIPMALVEADKPQTENGGISNKR